MPNAFDDLEVVNKNKLTKSSGVTIVCVGPQAMIPPNVHAAK
jgi:hypothetical protein